VRLREGIPVGTELRGRALPVSPRYYAIERASESPPIEGIRRFQGRSTAYISLISDSPDVTVGQYH